MELRKRRMLVNAFFISQFNYCLVIWMCRSRVLNNKINRLQLYKVANGMPSEIMNEIFQLREKSHYNLLYTSEFLIPPIHSVHHGSESVSYLEPKIWELIPPIIRQIDTFSGFKKAIKKWKPTNFPCRICKTYIPSVGFL